MKKGFFKSGQFQLVISGILALGAAGMAIFYKLDSVPNAFMWLAFSTTQLIAVLSYQIKRLEEVEARLTLLSTKEKDFESK